jgi:hypothetical protein
MRERNRASTNTLHNTFTLFAINKGIQSLHNRNEALVDKDGSAHINEEICVQISNSFGTNSFYFAMKFVRNFTMRSLTMFIALNYGRRGVIARSSRFRGPKSSQDLLISEVG